MRFGKCSGCGEIIRVPKKIRLPIWMMCDKCGKTALIKKVKIVGGTL